MRIRKTIAFLTAVAMIMALLPAMALTASAAEVTAIILSDGKTAYRLSGSNLIEDGSFESDAWEKQLTTGKWRGSNGVAYTAVMNASPVEGTGVWERSSEAMTGNYSLVLASDTYNSTNINDPNKPGSIKHYIKNTSNSSKNYYVVFYAKSVSDSGASFSLAAESNDGESGISGYTEYDVSPEWESFEAFVTVPAGNYLLLNIYALSANSVCFDDFAIYEAYTDSTTKAFGSAMKSWKFGYSDGDVISGDMTLPTLSKSDFIATWSSDNPDIISDSGKFTAPADDTVVRLTVAFSMIDGDFYAERTYWFTAAGFRTALYEAAKTVLPRMVDSDITLPKTVSGYDGSVISGWSSSNPEIISDSGVYNAPDKQTKVTLSATVAYRGFEIDFEADVITGVPESLISNGSFEEALDGKKIPGWTVGVNGNDSRTKGTAAMTTDYFTYETDSETGNGYIVSTGHAALSSPYSIRTYTNLGENKVYDLSFDVKYVGDGESEEQYIAAYVTNSGGAEEQYNSKYGGMNYLAGDGAGISAADGWQTYKTRIITDSTYHYLLVAAKWLNRSTANDSNSSNADARWAFDNFILTEVDIDFYGDVTINYLDKDTGEALKDPRTQTYVIGNETYTATDDDKANITVDGEIYGYDTASTDSVKVVIDRETGEANVINLYFERMLPVTVEFVDSEGKKIKDSETIYGIVGETVSATDEQKSEMASEDYLYYYDNSGVSTVTVTEDGDNVITLRFLGTKNYATNGYLTTGNSNGWTNRLGTAISGATIEYDEEIGANALLITTGGKTDTASIGTIWNVEKGKTYYMSFYVGGAKPESGNYQYNRVSNGYAVSGSNYENSGTDLFTFGADMVNGKWTKFEKTFVSESDYVYLQSSWAAGVMKFAKVLIYEVTVDYTADVTVNYLDRATGAKLKDSTVISDVDGYNNGSATYTADASLKEDITVGGVTYFYDTTSVDSTTVNRSGNVINLYFIELSPVSAEDVVLDYASSETPELPAQVSVTYTDGSVKETDVVWSNVPAAFAEGTTTVITGTAAGLEVTATVNVFYAIEGSSGGDGDKNDYRWVEVDGKSYPIEKDAANIVTNGDFTDGTNGWTNASNGGSLSANWSVVDSGYAKSGNSIYTSNGNVGGASDGTIRTFFKAEAGKSYYVAYRVYNAGTEATSNQNNSGMRALVGTEGYGYGSPKTCGASLYGVSDYGGFSSWTANATNDTDFPTIGTMPSRDDGAHAVGANDYATVINLPSTASNPYIMISLGAWSASYLYYSDFEIYEIANVTFAGMGSKIKVNVNGAAAGEVIVEKDSSYDFSEKYPNCIIDDSEIDTSVPNAGTVYIIDPATASYISFSGNKAVVTAVGEVLNGVLVVAQYSSDGELLKAEKKKVSIGPGETAELSYTAASGASEVKAMLFGSLENLNPLLRFATK